ncbi:conserved hypothetical protein [Dinoroseobacter shibae DFL 12 = DSM 16493]|jgi:hypothetical protein|uniref:3-dehydroquinate dehydratase n=1 Tax=Dinoroseobacter shibae (strain DSM 16493 / NCIMB 14021 / DFL 12) TaxID=398580 RepID=A8LP44_DINSH|nr:DUF2478 domain-containing protein [Dinoroseobacter shibae]ABV93726.1 conserved hypothetical protein [Dinoroseobacter shibae DFL 12 = DSM 16493]URF45180.1 DUF2478 domain-containing protein [Dinoroseobacter shibae]URF49485.1 DUF2478 domain-containing protein [Dinoroseobacter shibae]
MKIACTMSNARGGTDLLLWSLAARMQAAGVTLCGTVQTNTDCGDDKPCDMDVKILPDGPVVRISQSLGAGSRGCRLDPQALESAIGLSEAFLPQADLLFVNKFGKQEASGRGFRPLIAEALARDIPVLVGLNSLNAEAFETFTGGMAERLEPTEAAVEAWLWTALGSDPDRWAATRGARQSA